MKKSYSQQEMLIAIGICLRIPGGIKIAPTLPTAAELETNEEKFVSDDLKALLRFVENKLGGGSKPFDPSFFKQLVPGASEIENISKNETFSQDVECMLCRAVTGVITPIEARLRWLKNPNDHNMSRADVEACKSELDIIYRYKDPINYLLQECRGGGIYTLPERQDDKCIVM